MTSLRYYGLTPEEADQHGIRHKDGTILDGHHRAFALMQTLVAPAPPQTDCEDCGVRRAEYIVDTQRAEGCYRMCQICAFHSVKNRGMRFVRKTELAEKLGPASLAAPGPVTPGSAEPARAPGDHTTRRGE